MERMQTQNAPPFPLATLEAVLERITYANEETGYTIARVTPARGSGNGSGSGTNDLLTVVGNLIGVQPGESLRLQGRWTSHPQYGRQFEVQHYTTVLPATIQGIQRYLGSGLIKGIGPKIAERIVARCQGATLRIIEEEPARLSEVPGLGPKRAAGIPRAWEEQKAIKEVMLFLQGVGVSTSLAVRIYKTYQDASISVVKNEPYRLAADVWGIGFKTADKIAQSLGMPQDSPERIKAGLQFTLSEATEDGHCYLPADELTTQAAEILGVEAARAERCLDQLVAEHGVVRETLSGGEGSEVTAIYLVPFHRAEGALASGLLRLIPAPPERLPPFNTVNWEVAFGWLEQETSSALAPEQAEAVRLALTERVAVLTGGPGCGKSYTVRAIVTLARAKRAKVLLTAPTGRAAQRLDELTGTKASTLHRLLQLRPGGEAAYDRAHPLDADLVVVDEASMLDVLLANTLVKAIAPGAHLLFVGDVGGELAVRRGRAVFSLSAGEAEERVAGLPVALGATRRPRRFGLDPRRDVQILCPMHRGPAGAGALNERLQEALTPARPNLPERRYGGRVFRVGDKVTQVRNNYDKQDFNGAVGMLTGISLDDQQLRVRMDDADAGEAGEIRYDFDELDELTHAYAT